MCFLDGQHQQVLGTCGHANSVPSQTTETDTQGLGSSKPGFGEWAFQGDSEGHAKFEVSDRALLGAWEHSGHALLFM